MDILIVSIFIISGIIIGVRTGIALFRLNHKGNDATVTPKLHKVLYSLATALPVILLPIASLLSILDGSDRAIIVFSAWVLYCVTILATLRQLRKYKIVTSVKLIMLILSLAGVILAAQSHYRIEHNSGACLPIEQTQCGYKKVTNLDMYYEVHGSDKKPPLVILHGQLSTAGMFYKIVPELVKYRRVILVEQQAHGHTKDIDRPLSYSQMAEDTLNLLSQLSIKQADILGYSDGGIVALHMAKQQPAAINSLVLSSTTINTDGYKPEIRSNVISLSEQTIPQIVKNNYLLVAPDPEGFKILIKKSNEMNSSETGITFDQVKYMNVRKSMVISSSNDIMQKNHTDKLANALASKKVQVSGDHASYIIGDASEFIDILKDFYSK